MANTSITSIMDLSNPVFRAYLFYMSILIVKVLFSSLLTARQRFRKRVFISPEDTVLARGAKCIKDDPDVERTRRAHANDLENIPFFFTAAFAYMCTSPGPWLAQTLFLVYAVSRIVYTVVYAVVVMPQPTRAIVWSVGYIINIYMAVQAALYFY
ncbi:prostaglandin E synthase-like [Diaphorina citri]|uniref:Microsomal glutathione S-transferase 1 n=1 Tax=Diaphorina citri TaxID=121845 RepID=A0A1S3CUR9_DIACI|nr:prostaglandin E synthase-like [Diaphorina citri]